MTVMWTKEAKEDIVNYRKNSNIMTEEKIEKYINSLLDYVDTLSFSPRLGKVLFNCKGFEIRQLIYEMHRILYYIDTYTDKIYILVVSHTTRDMKNIIKYLNNNMEDFFQI